MLICVVCNPLAFISLMLGYQSLCECTVLPSCNHGMTLFCCAWKVVCNIWRSWEDAATPSGCISVHAASNVQPPSQSFSWSFTTLCGVEETRGQFVTGVGVGGGVLTDSGVSAEGAGGCCLETPSACFWCTWLQQSPFPRSTAVGLLLVERDESCSGTRRLGAR